MLIDVVFTNGTTSQWYIKCFANENIEEKIMKLSERFVQFGLILKSWKVASNQEIL